jgi:Spy/CpxP family protein refolding chaperone
MSRKSTITMLAALALILVLGIAACAQLHPTGPRIHRNNAVAQNPQTQAQGGAADLAAAWAGARDHPGAFASLERILLPPTRRELQQMAMVLNPTDEQKAQIKALYKALIDVVKANAPQKQESIKAIVAGLSQASPNKSDLEASAAKVAQSDQAIVSAELDFWIGLKGILNPQQQAQVQTMFQQRVLHETNPRQGGPGGPPPGGPAGPPPPQP